MITGTVPHDASEAPNGTVFVANELGGTTTVLRGDDIVKVFTDSVQPAGMAPVGNLMGMLDVRKNDLTVYDADALTIVGSTPAGDGPPTSSPTSTAGTSRPTPAVTPCACSAPNRARSPRWPSPAAPTASPTTPPATCCGWRRPASTKSSATT